MSLKVPAPLRRARAIKEELARLEGTGIACIVIPWRITSAVDPREHHSENLVYAGRPEPLARAESRASVFRYIDVQAFVVRPDRPHHWFYASHARLMKDLPPHEVEFALLRYGGRRSLVREVAPPFLTMTQAMGYVHFSDDCIDRMGNPWFLRHLRSEVGAVPIPEEFRP